MNPPRKTILVTGGSRGIGQAICQLYEAREWRVLAPTRAELDLADPDSIHRYFQTFEGALSALVNNAGINPINPISDVLEADLQKTIEVNLVAPFRVMQAALPALRRQPGVKHVVNISSIWAGVSKPGRAVYSMAKTGIIGLTKSAAVEWASEGILVNAVAPGFTLTELTSQNNNAEQLAEIESRIPLGRLAQPSEIAASVYFFASEGNTYITGQTLFVDGGFTCQ